MLGAPIEIELPDGGVLTIRRATANDIDGLHALYESLAVEDRRLRFFTASGPARYVLERFVGANEHGGLWLVAVAPSGDIVADGGYMLLDDGDADLGLTVAKEWRGWLGPYLLDVLARDAGEHGIRNLRADVLRENRPMLALVQHRGYAAVDQPDWSVATVTLSTGGGRPHWSPAHRRPRLLVEGCGGRWPGADAAKAAGWDVVTCAGPGSRSVRSCPVLEGEPCPLVEGADLVVLALPRSDPRHAALVEAHRRAPPCRPWSPPTWVMASCRSGCERAPSRSSTHPRRQSPGPEAEGPPLGPLRPLGVRPRRGHDGAMLTVTLNPSLDVSTRVPIVEPDRKLHCDHIRFEPGGGGVNVARVAHVLGADVTAVVVAGGCAGDRVMEMLAEQGVAGVALRFAEETRESLTVLETATGRQYRFVLPGPTIPEDDLSAAEDRIEELAQGSSYVVVSGSLPPGLSAGRFGSLLDRIRSVAAPPIVDTSGDALAVAASSGTLFMKPSVRELSQFAGHDLAGEPEIVAAAHDLLAHGPNDSVIVSVGPGGALLVRRDHPSLRVHGPRVHAVSTVGAGDSLVGAMAVALERGADMETAARWGVAAGTAATLSHGTGLCQAADVERLLQQVTVSTVPYA